MKLLKKFCLIILITLLFFLSFDFFFGKKIQTFLKISDDENVYRIKNEFYHHGFLKNFSTNKARWGNKFYKFCSDFNGFKYDCEKNYETVFDYAFIGDSFTEGIGLEYKDTFVGMFEKFTKFQTVNLGVSSYSPHIYKNKVIYLLDNKIINFNHLIVAVDLSDLNDDKSFNKINLSRENLAEINNKKYSEFNSLSEKIFQIKVFLKNNFIITDYLTRQIWWLGIRGLFQNYSNHYIAYNNRNSSWGYMQESTEQKNLNFMVNNMLDLSRYLKKKKIKLTLMIYPHPASILYDSKSSLYKKTWEEFCNVHCDNFIDSFSIFFDFNINKDQLIDKFYINGDVHFNKNGNNFLFLNLIKNYK